MSKTTGRQVNLKQDPPMSVEQMKDGEMRVEEDGILARVGNQVLQKSWMKALHYDDFEDGVVHSAWNNIYTYKNGGSHIEENGYMNIHTNLGGSGGQYTISQYDILAATPGITPVEGQFYFDVWGQMIAPLVPANNSDYIQVGFDFHLLGASKDYLRLKLESFNTNTMYRAYCWWHDGSAGQAISGTTLPFGPGANILWWRFKYLPGDSYIACMYHHGPENPFDSPYDSGWTSTVSISKNPPAPDGNDELRVRLDCRSYSAVVAQDWHYSEIAQWEQSLLTTTTTTTTTTQQMMFANSSNDGYIQYYNAPNFATAHDAVTGLGIGLANTRVTNAAGINYAGPTDYTISRTFLDFLLGLGAGRTIVGAELHMYGYFQGGQEACIQQGSQAAPPTLADYDSFTGPSLGNVASWDDAGWNVFTFNAAGLAYLNSVKTGTAKIVLREYDSDFLNVDLAIDSELGAYYADDATYKPFIVVYYS